jgi:hypothetical protein
MPTWLLYTLIRVGIFGGVFALLFLLGVDWLLAAIAAALIGFCVSYIFFRPLRTRVATDLAATRTSTRVPDDESAEDRVDSERDRGGES